MLDEDRCKGKTVSGERCKLRRGSSGYCHIHDPERAAEREAAQEAAEEARQKTWAKGEKLREVLEIVESTCRAKGWAYNAKNVDCREWRYASVEVSRTVSTERITGIFDISLDDGVRIASHKTSFHGYGLQDLRDAIITDLGELTWLESRKKQRKDKSTALFDKLERLLARFHIVARQLRRRYNGRKTLIVSDEYDVQDLLHALLKIVFDDVRPEEYSPSYAGASSRIDFLLKKEKIVVEVKMASATLRDKSIGEQLIVDMKRYQAHPDCNMLVCFAYDPEGHIRNPAALENDLSGKHDNIEVRMFVVPN